MLKKHIYKLIFIIAICSFTILSAFSATVEEIKQNIITQAKEIGVEPAIGLSIAKTESGFNQNAKSPWGQIGVFQLSPRTAKSMGYNPYDLDENIKAGLTYYKNLYNAFGSMELAVAAYNAGPYAIKRNNNVVPERTKPFVNKIMKNYNYYKEMEL